MKPICFVGCSIRYASGIVAEYQYSEGLLNETMIDELNITQGFNNCTDRTCEYGLIPSQQMIEVDSLPWAICRVHYPSYPSSRTRTRLLYMGDSKIWACKSSCMSFSLIREQRKLFWSTCLFTWVDLHKSSRSFSLMVLSNYFVFLAIAVPLLIMKVMDP